MLRLVHYVYASLAWIVGGLIGRSARATGLGRLLRDNQVDRVVLSGADALLLAPVSYTPLTQEEAYHHFAAVAGLTEVRSVRHRLQIYRL